MATIKFAPNNILDELKKDFIHPKSKEFSKPQNKPQQQEKVCYLL